MSATVDSVANFVTGNSSFLSHIHLIDAGGGGEVHKVCNNDTGKVFARKLIRLSPDVKKEDIINEMRAVVSLCLFNEHKNIITVFQCGCLSEPWYYIDMELCDFNLHNWICHQRHDRNKSSAEDSQSYTGKICEIMKDIISGVLYIHSRNQIHRDLKPRNVLYSSTNQSWKLTDFGLTMDGSSRMAHLTRYSRGTECYRAPELIIGTDYTNKVDVWAIGCILYELVFSRRPFDSDYAARRYAESGNEFEVPCTSISHISEEKTTKFITQIIPELLKVDAMERPSARLIYERFISWRSDISTIQTDRTIGLVQMTTNAFDMTIPSTSVLELPTPYATRPNPSLSHNSFPSDATRTDSSTTSIDHLASPVDHAVPTIVAQGLEHNHFAPDNSPVASWRAHPAPKRANHAEIERYNEQLLLAAKNCNVEDMRRPLGAGADVESKDKGGWTPLSLAAAKGHLEAVKFLVKEAGADVESKSNEGRTPLSCAAYYGNLEAVKFLVKEAGADVESKDKWGLTPLSPAAAKGRLEVVKFLVTEAGADVDSKDNDGQTPLSWAAMNGRLEVVKFLVKEARADVESKDEGGYTPLSCAAYYGNLEAVKFLVKDAGADVESKDNRGRTALELARQEGAREGWNKERCKAVAAWLEKEGGGKAGD